MNVIKNSIEAIDKFGIIEMRVLKKEKYLIILVQDNGIGMDANELEHMKEMFYTTKKNGTGLGVALSNEIVIAHAGSMEYESVKGKGTKCIISLPL